MYAKVSKDKVLQYPYDFQALLDDNPHTRFDDRFDLVGWFEQTEAAATSTLVEVFEEAQPDYDISKKNVALAKVPTLENNKWVLPWEITAKTEKEIAAYNVVLKITG